MNIPLWRGIDFPGAYIVAEASSMKDLYDMPRGKADWVWNHPAAAAAGFIQRHPESTLEQPAWPINESNLSENIMRWPGAGLKRL